LPKICLPLDFFPVSHVCPCKGDILGLVRPADKDLVQRVVRGDVDAFNLLVVRWEKKLFNFAFRLSGDREDAFDVCQDSFIRAYEQIRQLRDASKFSHWLFKIARNYCVSRHRSERDLPRAQGNNGDEGELDLDNLLTYNPQVRMESGHRFEQSELRLIVERALEYLPFEQRETVVLKVYEGLKFSEIAEISDCPVSTVKSRLYLGLTQLKKILANNQRGAP
jgi:RNA polymerase sigma-70 factor, ECF subfamily